MSFFVFPIECCYLVIEATEINGYYTNLIIPITEVIQYEQEYNRLMNLTASDSLCTCKLLNDVNFEQQMQTYKIFEPEDYCKCTCNFEQERKAVKRRVRKSPQLEIGDKVLYILSQIQANDLHFGYFMRKAPEKDRNYTLKRSSKYIGVSMNGNNWQTMINNGFGKKYIGTYSTEKEAAIAYDFYSFALHDCNHQTNFDYNVDTVEEMIRSFFENGKILIPSLFINKAFN